MNGDMKKILMAVVAMTLLAATASANVNSEGEQRVEERRSLKGFERIEQQGSIDVKYQQGSTFSVVVRAPRSVVKKVQTRVEGNKLIVGVKGESRIVRFGWSKSDDVTVYVTSPDLIGVELRGSGDFECKTHLDTDCLDISVKGSGDMDFYDIICDKINVSLVGSGDVDIRKVVTQQSDIQLVGSGDVKVSQQQSKLTRIALKGSGDIKVNCRNCGRVESKLLGSGDITLTGDVSTHQSTKRGSGDLHTDGLVVRNR